MDALGIPNLPVRSLRGGGTVALFEKTQNIPLVVWRGRWQDQRNLEYYLQEALGQPITAGLGADVRERLRTLERIYGKALRINE